MSRNSDIAKILGRTEAANASNTALGSGAAGGSLTMYDSIGLLPLSGVDSGSMAFVNSNARMYVNNGVGWYSATIVNNTPNWSVEPSSELTILDSATPLIVSVSATDSEGIPITYSGLAADSAQYLATISQDSSVFTFTPLTQSQLDSNQSEGFIADSGQNSFNYTFKASDGINIISKVSSITYNTIANSSSLLWRYVVVTPSNQASNLWDLDPSGSTSTGWYDGATQVTTGITLAAGTTLGAGKWGVFTSGANPLTDNTYNTWNAGPETGSLDYLVGGRTAAELDAGRFIAVRFSTEVSNISRIYHRTYTGARPDRIPNSARLEFYSGDVNQSYNSNLWVTYATLNHSQTLGWIRWDITRDGTHTSVAYNA
jgi:hypothetical protein